MRTIKNLFNKLTTPKSAATIVTTENFNFDVIGLQGQDMISGVRGTITNISESLSGSINVSIEPTGLFGKPTDSYSYDFQQVIVFEEGSLAARFNMRLPVIRTKAKFKLGERVKDQVSETEGLITRRTTYLNGCILYTVLPDGEKKLAEALHVFQPLLVSLQDGIDKDLTVDWDVNEAAIVEEPIIEDAVETTNEEVKKPRTGGPNERNNATSHLA